MKNCGLSPIFPFFITGPEQSSFKGTEVVDEGQWEYLASKGDLAISRNAILAAAGCATGCSAARCFAKFVKTYKDEYLIHKKTKLVELCFTGYCGDRRSYIKTTTLDNPVRTEHRERKEIIRNKSAILKIPAPSWAESECREWAASLN